MSMSAARMTKDLQVGEAVLRDKDLEWFQHQSAGPSSPVPARHTRPHGRRQSTPSIARDG
jgi:hypothetical protein